MANSLMRRHFHWLVRVNGVCSMFRCLISAICKPLELDLIQLPGLITFALLLGYSRTDAHRVKGDRTEQTRIMGSGSQSRQDRSRHVDRDA